MGSAGLQFSFTKSVSGYGTASLTQVIVREAAPETPDRVHLRSVTGLRFFAAFAVLGYHLVLQFGALWKLQHVTGFGYAAVSFFFVLSGFVLTWSNREGASSRQFYWGRFSRVWPLHAITTLLAVAVMAILSLPINLRALPLNATLTQAWSADHSVHFGFNAASWSLSAEAFFYLLFPVILVGLRSKKNAWQCAGVIYGFMALVGILVVVLIPRSCHHFLLYVFPAYRIGEFMIGICLALAIKRGWRPSFTTEQALAATALCYAALMAVTLLFFDAPGQMPSFVVNLGLIPGFVAIIGAAAAADLRGDQGFLSSAPVMKLGQWSFALYLVHGPILLLAAPSFRHGGMTPALIGAVIVVMIAIALSGALYEWVEKPTEKRLRGLFARRSTPQLNSVPRLGPVTPVTPSPVVPCCAQPEAAVLCRPRTFMPCCAGARGRLTFRQ